MLRKNPPQTQGLEPAHVSCLSRFCGSSRLGLLAGAPNGMSGPWCGQLGCPGPLSTWSVILGGQPGLAHEVASSQQQERNPRAQVPLPKASHTAGWDSRGGEMDSSSGWKELQSGTAKGQTNRDKFVTICAAVYHNYPHSIEKQHLTK